LSYLFIFDFSHFEFRVFVFYFLAFSNSVVFIFNYFLLFFCV
jgi:hypothetical protein